MIGDSIPGFPPQTMRDGAMIFSPATEWTGGGLFGNVDDLVRWSDALYSGRAMHWPYLDELIRGDPALPPAAEWYGLGTRTMTTPLGVAYGHAGEFPGYRSLVQLLPRPSCGRGASNQRRADERGSIQRRSARADENCARDRIEGALNASRDFHSARWLAGSRCAHRRPAERSSICSDRRFADMLTLIQAGPSGLEKARELDRDGSANYSAREGQAACAAPQARAGALLLGVRGAREAQCRGDAQSDREQIPRPGEGGEGAARRRKIRRAEALV